MKAIILTANGNPLETLKFSEIPEPGAPGKGEVIIRMEYSPIHPSDLMVAQGIYFVQPQLPSVIGVEGVGSIEATGPDVTHVKIGDRVNVPHGTYAWAELIKAPAKDLVVLPVEIDVQQASMIAANPVTAVLLLDEFVKLKKGDWIVLNAGNSSVAIAIISVAKSRGLNVVAIVRRAKAIDAAEKAGADVVLVESATVANEVKKLLAVQTLPWGWMPLEENLPVYSPPY